MSYEDAREILNSFFPVKVPIRSLESIVGDLCDEGYPIGSGVIEGACRNLINDRLELTGMSWMLREAESMMRLAAVHINKDWGVFWNHRRKLERRRLYGVWHTDSSDIRHQELPRAS